MSERCYRVLVAQTEAGLHAAAEGGGDWTILETTVREFVSLETDTDLSLGDIGAVTVNGPGWVALAYRIVAEAQRN